MTTMDPNTKEGLLAALDVATAAAREAAALVHAGWRSRPLAKGKRTIIDLVTEYDQESERVLRERLTAKSPFPLVGEEGTRVDREGQDATWYIDPLDGTTNFVHGHPFYCVSVGLLLGAQPVLGVVVAPSLGFEWHGAIAQREGFALATRNDVPIRVSETATLGESLIGTGFPYDRATDADNNFAEYLAIKLVARGVRRCGSAAIDLCFVGDGTYDGYWEKKLKVWDLAAGATVVRAAGGTVTAFDGGPPDLSSGSIVATNGRIHVGVVGRIQAAGKIKAPLLELTRSLGV
jgi:myo-inositol-1(or 4)-monophosphatase